MAARRKRNLFGNKAEGSRTLKRILLWCCAVAGGVLVLLGVAWYQALAYLQSESFRETLSSQLGGAAHAKSLRLLSPLHIDGERVTEEGLEIDGAGSLRSARAGRISLEAERMALLQRRVHLRKVSVEEAELLFDITPAAPEKKPATTGKKKKSVKVDKTAAARPEATVPAEGEAKKSFFALQGWGMELMECKDTELTLRRGEENYRLQGCTVTTTPMKKGGWQHVAENGSLHTPFALLHGASVKSATLQQDVAGLSLTDCRIMLSPGELRVRAHRDAATEKWSANLTLNKAAVTSVLRGDWKKRVTGELYGKLTLTGAKQTLAAGDGYLSLQEGVLEGLPFLSELPGEGGYPYRHLPLDKAECRLSFPFSAPELNIAEAWLVDNINIRAKNGLLRVHGHVIIGTDGSLGGTLTVGLPENGIAALASLPGMNNIFNAQGEPGFRWVNINLSGTTDEPEEDLSVRCAALMKNALPQVAGQAAATAEQMLHLLLNPAKPAPAAEGETKPAATPADPLKAAADGVQQGINGALKLLF